ncbi:MAG TPA: HAD family hydrolase [Vicinamibacterales bacterium]
MLNAESGTLGADTVSTDARPVRLLLFDIDGTLILTGGAGKRAMTRALADTHGIEDGLSAVDVAGRTDRLILRDALRLAGHEYTDDALAEFRRVYRRYLQEEIPKRGTGGYGVLPGVKALLDALAARDDVELALLTGNFPESAEIKLAAFGLWEYFAWGVFGDEAFDREHLMPIALARHAERQARPVDPAQVVVIGDTPHDISCARHGGARVVAVATGHYDVQALERCNPDALFPDLAQTDHILRALLA